MVINAYTDERPTLQIAQETWDREDPDGQRRLVQVTAAQGYRLSVIRPHGEVWTPDPLVAEW